MFDKEAKKLLDTATPATARELAQTTVLTIVILAILLLCTL